jgi:hypothetical protein
MSKVLVDTVDLDIWTIVVISSSLLTSIQVVGKLDRFGEYGKNFVTFKTILTAVANLVKKESTRLSAGANIIKLF